MRKKKVKNNISISKEIRKYWIINPKTRVKDNDLKSKKKRRKKEKKMINNYLRNDHFFLLYSLQYNIVCNTNTKHIF
ncbi:MAG: hypothetical protein ABF289_17105 [Clostridiales bacterium]